MERQKNYAGWRKQWRCWLSRTMMAWPFRKYAADYSRNPFSWGHTGICFQWHLQSWDYWLMRGPFYTEEKDIQRFSCMQGINNKDAFREKMESAMVVKPWFPSLLQDSITLHSCACPVFKNNVFMVIDSWCPLLVYRSALPATSCSSSIEFPGKAKAPWRTGFIRGLFWGTQTLKRRVFIYPVELSNLRETSWGRRQRETGPAVTLWPVSKEYKPYKDRERGQRPWERQEPKTKRDSQRRQAKTG